MSAKITVDVRQFQAALKEYRATTTKALPEVLNQRAFNIAARTIDSLKPTPGGEQSQRSAIKAYMDSPRGAPKLRVVASGPKRGQLKRVGRKQDMLTAKHLILQARRAKKGLKGLYGQAMRLESGEFTRRAQVGVGFLKSPFVPILKGLVALVKFRKVATRWGRISVWAGSSGFGKVTPARAGLKIFTEMKLHWKLSGAPDKVRGMVLPKLQAAFNAEAVELARHTREKLQQAADKVNARWRQSTFQK